jgi:glycosyltransferase involved in cell wall biosynthesis
VATFALTDQSPGARLDGTQGPRVALAHDFLLDLRGAERVFLELCRIWPEADIFTAAYDQTGTEGRFADRNVRATYLQRLQPTARTFRGLLPLYPHAIESLDLSGYDLVISSSSAWAHGVRPRPGAVHVSYCHNPFRYAWNERDETLERRGVLTRPVLAAVLARWRRWDRGVASRVDHYVANSELTRDRIAAYFGRRDVPVVYPPVEVERFSPRPVGRHYVCLAELVAHKQLDIAVEAFNRLDRQLLIVGDGPDYRRLKRLAGPTVAFAGRLSDEAVVEVLGGAQALIVCASEEFGIAAVEAQAAGRPVIARRSGGVLETVVDGVTGCFWEGGADALVAAVEGFDTAAVDPAACVAQAARFSTAEFERGIREQVDLALDAVTARG